ncbi:MAG: peptidylprolyl isomerase [Flavitalea sp.]
MLLKIIASTGLGLFTGLVTSAQNLFTYGNHGVSKAEFLTAYNKNNNDSSANKISYAEYLNLYTKFRLKVQAATDARMDTTAEQRTELDAFRIQLAEGFIKDDASMKLMVDEASERSKKDIYLSHIFFPASSGSTSEELTNAQTRIKKVYERLQKGESYEKLAAEPGGANLGYITVFVLPYAIENIAYATPVGGYSTPYQSSAGFHIFKNMGERKAVGKIRVAQILLTYPPDDKSDEAKKTLTTRADSIYNALQAGADFATLAGKLSNDNLSYQAGGQIPIFGVGQYDSVFENQAFALAKDSDISKPFFTSFGVHILKRIQLTPVVENSNNKEWRENIKEHVLQSDRMQVAQVMLLKNVRETIKKDAPPKYLSTDTGTLNYYRNHLEKYNPEFAGQLKEFREGNLLFAIMQKKVWDAASADSAAILQYYKEHLDKYSWDNSANALIITCINRTIVPTAQNLAKTNFESWKKWADHSNAQMQVDSGRFELSQIPVRERTNFTEGLITAPVSNDQDSTVTFAYIIKLYKEKQPKNFEDAKGSVINDYQSYLEDQWIIELKKRYPIKINNDVLQGLNK